MSENQPHAGTGTLHLFPLRGWDYPLLLVGLAVLLVGLAVLATGVGPYKLSYGHIFSLIAASHFLS